MAIRTISNAGGDYNTTGAWVEGIVPTSADDVVATATSGNLTVTAIADALSIDFTNYLGTLTINQPLRIFGNVNLGTGAYNITGTNSLATMTTSTITSNGTPFKGNIAFSNNNTIVTLADDLTINGVATFNGTTVTINGNNLHLKSSMQFISSLTVQGTTNFNFIGTGSWTETGNGILKNNFTINTSGTFTMVGSLLNYNTGTFKYISGTVITTGSTLNINASTTLNTNGIIFNNVTFGGASQTYYLASNLTTTGTVRLNGTGTPTLSGNTLFCRGNLSVTNGDTRGSTQIVLNGTGTWSHTNAMFLRNDITINTTGTTTVSGVIYWCQGTLTYSAGTVITTGSTINTGGIGGTFNTNGVIWNNFIFPNTIHTLLSPLNATGSMTLASSGNITFKGPAGFTIGTFLCSTAGRTIFLNTGNTYTVTNNMTTTATLAGVSYLQSIDLVNGTKAIFNLSPGATQDNGYFSAIDIDSSGGRSIWTYKGVLTRTINWNQMSTNPKKHILSSNNRIIKHT